MKITLTMMALGASALAANASFAEIPNTTDRALAQLAPDGFTSGENSYQPAPSNVRRFSNSLETSSGVAPRSIVGIIPEPTTIVAGALLLLPLGMSALRVLRREKSDPAKLLNTI